MILPSPFSTPRATFRVPGASSTCCVKTTLRLQVDILRPRSKPISSAELKSRPAKPSGGRRPPRRKDTNREYDDTFFQDYLREAEIALEGVSQRPDAPTQSMKKLANLPRRSIATDSAEQAIAIISRTLEFGPNVRRKSLLLSHLGKAFQAQPALQKCAQNSPDFKKHLSKVFSAAAAERNLFSDVISVSQLATAQVKLRYYSQDVWDRYELSGLSSLSAQAFSNVLHSAAKLHVTIGAPRPSDTLQQHIWDALRQDEGEKSLVANMDPQNVSNSLWAFAKLQMVVPADVQSILEAQVIEVAGCMNSQDVANISWAFAKLGLRLQPATYSALQQVAARVAPSMNAQHIANTWWAFAKMDIDVLPATNSALQTATARVAPNMNAQNVTNTWWAYAKMGIEVLPATSSAVQQEVARVAPIMNSQNVANTWWAYAKMENDVPPAANSALQQAVSRVAPAMNAQEVVNTFWAFATMGTDLQPTANSALQQAMARTIPAMNVEQITSTWWAYNERQVPPPDELVDDLLATTAAAAPKLSARQISIIKTSVAGLGLASRAASDESWQSGTLHFTSAELSEINSKEQRG